MAIVGISSTTRHQAPFFDDEFEIWGLNEAHYAYFPRFDRWFEMHDRNLMEQPWRNADHFEWLKECRLPVYMQSQHDDIPASVGFPRDQVIEEFGDYFTSTVPYMLALAIYEGFSEIHLYGVDATSRTDYESQKASIEYFIGIARGRGITVYIPDDSNLLKAKRAYGYQSGSIEEELELRIDELKVRHEKLKDDLKYVEQFINQCHQSKDPKVHAVAGTWQQQRERLIEEFKIVVGALQECLHWSKRLGG